MTTISRSILSPGWATNAATAPVVAILLHGYGSDEHDLTGLVPPLGLALPWASLRAPLDAGNGGATWFTMVTPGDPAEEPLVQATDAIWSWLDDQVGSSTAVIPIGFSQGGLMASQLLRTRPERVLAPVVLGGFVLGAPQPGDARLAAERPAAFWGRGAEDSVITADAVERTSVFLPHHSTLTERVYPGLAHGIHAEEIADVAAFLESNVRL